MIAFVPAWAGLLFYGFYAVLAIIVLSLACIFLKRFTSLKGLTNFFISATVAGLTVYCLLPRLWNFAEVNAVAKPGMPFSSVVEQLGNPSWKTQYRNGDVVNGYNVGFVVGSVTVTVAPDGIVKDVSFAD